MNSKKAKVSGAGSLFSNSHSYDDSNTANKS